PGGAAAVARLVRHDLQQPRSERRARAEAAERAVGLHEPVLCALLRVCGRARDQVCRPEGGLLMPSHEFLVGRGVATLRLLDEHRVIQWPAHHWESLHRSVPARSARARQDGAVTSMPPPWEPDDEETQETRILPPDEQTRIAPRTPSAGTERTVVEEEELPPEPPPGGRGRDLWPWLLLVLGIALALIAAFWWFSRDDDDAAATKPVPSVVRLPVDEARGTLEEQGFVVNAVPKPSDEADEGIVFAQKPEAGTQAADGSVVTIDVSSGPATVTVPDVIGVSVEDATQQLEQAKLVARPSTVPSSQPQGRVVAQSPSAGEKVARDSPVRINVSGGPGTATVPDVRGS